jgi:integrase
VRARGSKTANRDRTISVTEAWAWARVAAYLRAHRGLRDALLFAEVMPSDEPAALAVASDASRRALAAACKVRKIAGYRQHDHRHTYAVQAVRDGMPLPLIAKQLGHANTLMVQKVYGKYQPTADDYARYAAKSAQTGAESVPVLVTGTAGADGGQS